MIGQIPITSDVIGHVSTVVMREDVSHVSPRRTHVSPLALLVSESRVKCVNPLLQEASVGMSKTLHMSVQLPTVITVYPTLWGKGGERGRGERGEIKGERGEGGRGRGKRGEGRGERRRREGRKREVQCFIAMVEWP